MSLKATKRLAKNLESRQSPLPPLFQEISLSGGRHRVDTMVLDVSNAAIFHFLENTGLLDAPETSRSHHRRIIAAYLTELERRTWNWTLSAFVLGIQASKVFTDADEGWSVRPPTDDEIRRLRRWGQAVENVTCYEAMTVMSWNSSSEPFPGWEERNKVGRALERRAGYIIQCLRLQGDLRVMVPLMVLYSDSLFSRAEVTALKNKSPFPYPGWADDEAQEDPDDPSWKEEQVWLITRSRAKSCALNTKIAGRLFRHVRACAALHLKYFEIGTSKDADRMRVAWRRYNDACVSLGIQTPEEESISSSACGQKSPHEESVLESSLLNLVIALESLLGEKGQGVQDRILKRVTLLVAPILKNRARPSDILDRLRKCYLLRDKIVHGVPLKEQDWKDLGSHIRWLQAATACAILRVHEIGLEAGANESLSEARSILQKVGERLDRSIVDDHVRRALAGRPSRDLLYAGVLRTDFYRPRYRYISI